MDINSGEEIKTLKGRSKNLCSAVWSPDGQYIASSALYGFIDIWNVNSGKCIKTFNIPSKLVDRFAFSPDGNYIVAYTGPETIEIWNVNSGKRIKTLEGHSKEVLSVAYSPDGSKIVSGSRDKTVKIWDANTGECLKTLTGHSDYVCSVAYSPDGSKIVSGSGDKTAKIWDANSGECMQTLEGHSDAVSSVTWRPDGKYIVSGSSDKTLKIWNTNSGKCMQTLEGHSDAVISVTWSSSGGVIVSGSLDKTIKIWYGEQIMTETVAIIEAETNRVVKKSTEKTGDETLITEYDQQGNIIKIRHSHCSDCSFVEFKLKNGKILATKVGDGSYDDSLVDKQENTARHHLYGTTYVTFNEFGYKEIFTGDGAYTTTINYEYNEDGLLVKSVVIDEDRAEGTSEKTTITYTYDMMSQDWTKRTGTDNNGKQTVTTRTVEYW